MADKVVAVVQARMGSTRLPNKAMLWLNGWPVIHWVQSRLHRCASLDEIIFAIPWTPENDVLDDILVRIWHQWVYRGPENDVLTRITEAARLAKADIVVRVCADNPFVSPEAVDLLTEMARVEHKGDHLPMGALFHWYMSTNGRNKWADGFGAEAVSYQTLLWAWQKSIDREHILNHVLTAVEQGGARELFPTPPEALSQPDLKLDLDTYEDYQRLLASGVDIDMTAAEIVGCFL